MLPAVIQLLHQHRGATMVPELSAGNAAWCLSHAQRLGAHPDALFSGRCLSPMPQLGKEQGPNSGILIAQLPRKLCLQARTGCGRQWAGAPSIFLLL